MLGEDHRDYISVLNDIGNVHFTMKRYGKALEIYSRCCDFYGKFSGKKSVDYLINLSNLAMTYLSVG